MTYNVLDEIKIEELKFDDKGLIPAIVVDRSSGRVLTLAYMNKESLEITIDEGRTCFFSRSRNTLWRKGESSGNVQRVVSMATDCDQDALVVFVDKTGPACHLGNDSCFEFPIEGFRSSFKEIRDLQLQESGVEMPQGDFSFDGLYNLLKDRKEKMPEGSYTTYLFDKGVDKILKKIGEESTEVVIAGKAMDRRESVYEIADLAYHVMVLMVELGITPEDVKTELESRHVIDKKVKQEKMV